MNRAWDAYNTAAVNLLRDVYPRTATVPTAVVRELSLACSARTEADQDAAYSAREIEHLASHDISRAPGGWQ
eukprot:418896-Hanusia_phi.AAC.1